VQVVAHGDSELTDAQHAIAAVVVVAPYGGGIFVLRSLGRVAVREAKLDLEMGGASSGG
jgi:hypothetical protein